uniref:BHLH domain-containing protein n=1 Tax=Macrostomum lignano TaxID=282301 RepID=A0A1I8FHN2_9PLAT
MADPLSNGPMSNGPLSNGPCSNMSRPSTRTADSVASTVRKLEDWQLSKQCFASCASGDPNVTMANAERQLALYFQEKRPHIAENCWGANKLDDLSFESKARLLKKVIDYLKTMTLEMQDMKYEPQQSAQDDTGQVAINCGIDSRNRRHFYLDDHRLQRPWRKRLPAAPAVSASSGVGRRRPGSVGKRRREAPATAAPPAASRIRRTTRCTRSWSGPCAEEWERFTARMTASKNENERDMGVFLQSCLPRAGHRRDEAGLPSAWQRRAASGSQQQQITQPPYAPQTATDFVAPADRQQMQLPQQQQFVANSPASSYCPPESMYPHAVMMNHARRLPPQQQPPPVPPPPTAAIAQPAPGGKRQHPYAQPTTLNTAATTSSSTPTPAAAPKPASGASKRRKKDQQQKQQQQQQAANK